MQAPPLPDPVFATLLQLQNKICLSNTPEAFHYTAVNETLLLVSYRQAALWRYGPGQGQIEAVSGLPIFEREAPYIQWLSSVFSHLSTQDHTQITPITQADLPETLSQYWSEWLPRHALWLPLILPSQTPELSEASEAWDDGEKIGGFFLAREGPWRETEKQLLSQLALTMVPVWWGLLARRNRWRRLWEKRPRLGRVFTTAILLGTLLLPVRQSVLAPAEIVALKPTIVRAPIDGVVDSFLVRPNEPVTQNQPLFTLDATKLTNRRQVTEKELEVAQAEHRRALQKVLRDPSDKAKVALLKGRVAQQTTDLAYIHQQLERTKIAAGRAGLAVFTDENDWIGRPVKLGERIMMLADPEQVEIEIRLPVADAVTLTLGADIELFLAINPNHAYAATLRYASYQADLSPEGILAYRLKAEIKAHEQAARPRLGLRGTAKIYGEEVRLFYYLLRRPLAMARQHLGL